MQALVRRLKIIVKLGFVARPSLGLSYFVSLHWAPAPFIFAASSNLEDVPGYRVIRLSVAADRQRLNSPAHLETAA